MATVAPVIASEFKARSPFINYQSKGLARGPILLHLGLIDQNIVKLLVLREAKKVGILLGTGFIATSHKTRVR